jgi:hypothetical protein
LDFGEGASKELDVLSQTSATRAQHGAYRINDELGAREARRRLSEVDRGDLEKYEDVVAKDGLDWRLAEILDLL